MDKEKIDNIIELLEQIKDHLKDDLPAKVNVKARFELRYWNDGRPHRPTNSSNDFPGLKTELYNMIKMCLHAEMIDRETGNIIISYNEEL